jgi:hypothetical protein
MIGKQLIYIYKASYVDECIHAAGMYILARFMHVDVDVGGCIHVARMYI